MKLSFLGGVGGVTGSKYLLESDGTKVLVDCGLFQGLKELRLKNWSSFPISPSSIDAVVLTHAHLDHSGYVPRFISQGFDGPIYTTEPTRELCKILLSDSGHLQEEEASYRNKKGQTKHKPALPLYTQKEAEHSLENFAVKTLNQPFKIGPFEFNFREAGHILGASSILVNCHDKTFIFSGDLGRFDDPLITSPDLCPKVDYVIMESTYGDRNHPKDDPIEFLAEVMRENVAKAGVLLIPSFAVGRTQTLLYLFYQVFEKYPDLKVPVYLNSPMATDVTALFRHYINEHKLEEDKCHEVCDVAHYVGSADESKELNKQKGPMAIISASGMLTGGRILHHLKAFGKDPNNTILLVVFQAPGTRGYTITSGSRELKIHGQYHQIKANVLQIDALSAHADQKDLLHWLSPLKTQPPKKIFLTHGEPSSSDALRLRIKDKMNIECHIPHLGESIEFNDS